MTKLSVHKCIEFSDKWLDSVSVASLRNNNWIGEQMGCHSLASRGLCSRVYLQGAGYPDSHLDWQPRGPESAEKVLGVYTQLHSLVIAYMA
jgi:hypothetical protein